MILLSGPGYRPGALTAPAMPPLASRAMHLADATASLPR
jgi:hypothetical protein